MTVHSPTVLSHLLRHRIFTYVTSRASHALASWLIFNIRLTVCFGVTYSPTFPSLHLGHNSFSNPFRRFTYVTAHFPNLPLLHICDSSFSNPFFVSLTSKDLHLRHLVDVYAVLSWLIFNIIHTLWSYVYCNLSDTLTMAQFILEHFRRFSYTTAHSPTLPFLHLRDSSFFNPTFVSPTPQELHFRHLESHPCSIVMINIQY